MSNWILYLDNNFTGNYMGCEFKKGTATTDNEMIVNYFKRHNLKYEKVKVVEKEIKETNIDFKKVAKATGTNRKTKK